jgi:cellulose synthase/poly-beta-1,6-N-acetylglucosamine synthase-like glycosyltransferase
MLAKSLNEMRKNRFKKKKFIEHSVNLLAMKSGIIKEIPLDVAEGAILSFIISNKGYKNVYVEKAKVLVIYPKTFKLFLSQRMRSAKAHMELTKYTKNSRIKYSNFYNEVLYYATRDIFNNFFWSLSFVIILLYTQIKVFYDLRIRKKHYNAVWKCTNTN